MAKRNRRPQQDAPPRREYSRPAAVQATELPIFGTSTFDRVQQVRAALAELESGVFARAAQLVDAMGRDDRLEAVLPQRIEALEGLPFTLQPVDESERANGAAAEAMGLWPSMVPGPARAELLHWGLMLGVAVGQNVWTSEEGRWVSRLKVWHPRYVRFDWTTRAYHLVTNEGAERRVTAGDGEWVLYTPYGLERGWMRSLVRSLAIPFLVRQFAVRDWARYSEVHGQPIKKAVVPAGAPKEQKDAFVLQVAALAHESTLFVEQQQTGDTKEVFDLELVEAAGDSTDSFDKLIARCDVAMAVRVLGQNLTTEVKEGSRAAASVHERVALRKLAFDATSLSECLREQVLMPWAAFNHGDSRLAPHPAYDTNPPEDLSARATSYQGLGAGLQALQKAGVPVDVMAEAERFGVLMTAAEPVVPPPDAGALKRALALLSATAPTPAERGQGYADRLTAKAAGQAAAVLADDLEALLSAVEGAESPEDMKRRLVRVYGAMRPDALAALTERTMLLAELSGRLAVQEDVDDGEE